MTKAQQTYERINTLVDGGMQKADAFKQLAEEYGQPVDSVRGAYYGHKRVLERGDEPGTTTGRPSARRSRKRETTTEDAVASAVATLHAAIDAIMAEVATAQERAVEAAAECKALQATASSRIEAIQAKIAVLDPTAADDSSKPNKPGSGATALDATPATMPKEVKGS